MDHSFIPYCNDLNYPWVFLCILYCRFYLSLILLKIFKVMFRLIATGSLTIDPNS